MKLRASLVTMLGSLTGLAAVTALLALVARQMGKGLGISLLGSLLTDILLFVVFCGGLALVHALGSALVSRHRGPGSSDGELESAHRRRLGHLRGQADQMRETLAGLQALSPDPDQASRVRRAEADLLSALERTRVAMAAERAALFGLEAGRWAAQLEPLARDLPRLTEAGTSLWAARLEELESQGADLARRLRADEDACAHPVGAETLRAIEAALAEMGPLRADLLVHRAELLARQSRTGLAAGLSLTSIQRPAFPPGIARLRLSLDQARAQREVDACLWD